MAELTSIGMKSKMKTKVFFMYPIFFSRATDLLKALVGGGLAFLAASLCVCALNLNSHVKFAFEWHSKKSFQDLYYNGPPFAYYTF